MAHLLLRPVRDQGLLGQVEGRTADDAAYWLARASPAWRDRIEVVAIGMCSIYASTIRRILPQAQIVVDLFHAVQLAVKVTGDVRRRAVREKYGGAAGPAMPSTGSRARWCATWSTCHPHHTFTAQFPRARSGTRARS